MAVSRDTVTLCGCIHRDTVTLCGCIQRETVMLCDCIQRYSDTLWLHPQTSDTLWLHPQTVTLCGYIHRETVTFCGCVHRDTSWLKSTEKQWHFVALFTEIQWLCGCVHFFFYSYMVKKCCEFFAAHFESHLFNWMPGHLTGSLSKHAALISGCCCGCCCCCCCCLLLLKIYCVWCSYRHFRDGGTQFWHFGFRWGLLCGWRPAQQQIHLLEEQSNSLSFCTSRGSHLKTEQLN